MKIGITTYYYQTVNYGGALQAYALTRVLQKLGYDAEQICFNTSEGCAVRKVDRPLLKRIEIGIKEFIVNCLNMILHPTYRWNYWQRRRSMLNFGKEVISHSAKVYTMRNIGDTISVYDKFVTGSDVVWHPSTDSYIFLLRFLPKEKPKISYAASLGVSMLTTIEKERFQKDLKSFQAVSVREKAVVPILEEAIGKIVHHCVDPTLLLDEADWMMITTHRQVEQPYVFCYFLGNNREAKQVAIEYARKHDLTLINIPYLWDSYNEYGNFGDIRPAKVSPKEFLSYIKYAECVFTDSFHACVFSNIFKTNFYVFRRSKDAKLTVRISDFLALLGCISHFCDTDEKESVEYCERIDLIDYAKINNELELLKWKSKEYLKNNLM